MGEIDTGRSDTHIMLLLDLFNSKLSSDSERCWQRERETKREIRQTHYVAVGLVQQQVVLRLREVLTERDKEGDQTDTFRPYVAVGLVQQQVVLGTQRGAGGERQTKREIRQTPYVAVGLVQVVLRLREVLAERDKEGDQTDTLCCCWTCSTASCPSSDSERC